MLVDPEYSRFKSSGKGPGSFIVSENEGSDLPLLQSTR